MQYRLLLACGSAIAAMGGVDEIIFSGCYAQAGQYLGPWLSSHLSHNPSMGQVPWRVFGHPLEQIVAEQALTVCPSKTPLAFIATVP